MLISDEMWYKYNKTKDIAIRNDIINKYIGTVELIARKMYIHLGKKVDYEELVSYGVLGLIDSIDKYDIETGNKFETYASIRIRGSMLDQLRKNDIVPRSVRSRSKEIQKATELLESRLFREATNKEIAKYLNIEEEEVTKNLKETSVFNITSLEEVVELQEINIVHKEKTPEKLYLEKEKSEILKEALNSLKERDRNILIMYYYEELTLREIATLLGISESRVSQINSRLIVKLRNILKNTEILNYE